VKTLVIAPYTPWPLTSGGAIRLYYAIRMFAEFSDVTVLAYRTVDDGGPTVAHLEKFCERAILVEGAPLETRRKWWLQARGLVGRHTFQYHSFHTPRFQHELDALLEAERFDHILVEQSQMACFRYRQPGAIHILDQQNIEFELLQRRAAVHGRSPKGLALAWEALRYRREELTRSEAFDLVLTCSEREAEILRWSLVCPQVAAVPNTIDPEDYPTRVGLPEAPHVAFVGTTHVDANRDGVIFFMEHVFPLIERRVPEVTFSIVGGRPPADIRVYGERPNVEVTGLVDDVRPHMARARVLIVPLRSGSGTRLKILEGLCMGIPMVSTSVGAEGIDVRAGEHLLIADEPEAFADEVVRLLQDDLLCQRLARAGRQVVEDGYSWRAAGMRLEALVAGTRAEVEPSRSMLPTRAAAAPR
jgi:polysaccharide biosynthesis protein PslH